MIQMILSVGAMVLLGTAIVSMNSGFDANAEVMRSSKVAVLATSLAGSKVEEACGKAFDENTADTTIGGISDLTVSAYLGPDGGEVYPFFNDMDDFNNMVKYDTVDAGGTLNNIPFITKCRVVYTNPATPDVAQAGQSWVKKITVVVTSPAMSDTVRQEAIFTYFHFQ